jgi:hypothetical protein
MDDFRVYDYLNTPFHFCPCRAAPVWVTQPSSAFPLCAAWRAEFRASRRVIQFLGLRTLIGYDSIIRHMAILSDSGALALIRYGN